MKRINLFLVTLFIWSCVATYGRSIPDKKGTIVFYTEKSNTSKTGEVENKFSMMDNIYLKININKSLADYYKEYNYNYDYMNIKFTYNYALRLIIDGEQRANWLFEMPKSQFNATGFLDYVLSSDNPHEQRKNSSMVNEWVDIVKTLKDGDHSVQFEMVPMNVELTGDDVPVIASGEFTLSVDTKKMDEFVQRKETGLPPATIVNPAIEEKIVEASENIIPNAVPLRAFITDYKEDWTYSVDDNGDILYRHIIASVVYRYLDGVCWVKTGLYGQKHEGYGEFGPMIFEKFTEGYYDYTLPCDIVNK